VLRVAYCQFARFGKDGATIHIGHEGAFFDALEQGSMPRPRLGSITHPHILIVPEQDAAGREQQAST